MGLQNLGMVGPPGTTHANIGIEEAGLSARGGGMDVDIMNVPEFEIQQEVCVYTFLCPLSVLLRPLTM